MWLLLSTDHTTDHTGSVVWKTNRWCLATCISGNDNCCLGICEGRKSRNTGSVKCVPSECGHIGGVKAKEDLSMTAASALWRAENLILSYLSNHPCGNGVVRDAITPFFPALTRNHFWKYSSSDWRVFELAVLLSTSEYFSIDLVGWLPCGGHSSASPVLGKKS